MLQFFRPASACSDNEIIRSGRVRKNLARARRAPAARAPPAAHGRSHLRSRMLYFNYTSGDRASAVVYIYSQDRFKSSVSTYRKHGVGGPRALARAPRDRQRATTMCTAGGTRGNHSTAPVTPKRRRAAVAPSATAASESPERAVATRAAIARACAAHADSPATRRRWDMPSHARMTPLQPPKSVPLRVAESPEVPPMQEKATVAPAIARARPTAWQRSAEAQTA